jgi:DNA-binding NtrC family response regulator
MSYVTDDQRAEQIKAAKAAQESDVQWAMMNQLNLLSDDAGLNPTILIVDDEPEITIGIAEFLELELQGYAIETASCAAEALDKLAANEEVGIVIADIRMPGMSGIEMVAQMNKAYAERHIQVIFLTGHAGLAEAIYANRLNVFEFMTKPFSPVHLAHVVSQAGEMLMLRRHERQMKRFYTEEIARLASRVLELEEQIRKRDGA